MVDANRKEAARAVSTAAFCEEIPRRYERIFLIAYAAVRDRDAADDLAQETFLRGWLHLDKLREPENLDGWLGGIARNLARQWLRQGRTRSRLVPLIPLEEMTVEPKDATFPDPGTAAARQEQHAQLQAAVMALPDDLREIVLLHYASGLSQTDIARMAGVSVSSISRRLQQAQKQLRGLLEGGDLRPLAFMGAPATGAARALAVISGAAAAPAAVRAQLLAAAADTPLPPSVQNQAAGFQKLTTENSMFASLMSSAAVKTLAAVAAAGVVIGGGVLVSQSQQPRSRSVSAEKPSRDPSAAAFTEKVRIAPSSRQPQNTQPDSPTRKTQPPQRQRTRMSPADRVAALRSDLTTTHPVILPATDTTSETLQFDVQVVNQSGLPVEGAAVVVHRYNVEMSSSFKMSVDLPTEAKTTVSTSNRGIARLTIPTHPYGDFPVSGIQLQATHKDYVSTNADMALTSITKVVLEQGLGLDVLPVDAATSAPLTGDVTPDFGMGGHMTWEPGPDGVIQIRKIRGETAVFYLRHKDAAGNLLLSREQHIELPRKSRDPLQVPLYTALTARGRLSAAVPRPVEGLRVTYAHPKTMGDGSSKLPAIIDDVVDVAADGSFEIPGLAPGVRIALAVRDKRFASVSTDQTGGEAQAFVIEPDQEEIELKMAPTVSMTVTLVDSDRRPVPGVSVAVTPEITWFNHSGPWGTTEKGITDEDGKVVVSGIPAGTLSVNLDGWQIIENASTPSATAASNPTGLKQAMLRNSNSTRVRVKPEESTSLTLTVQAHQKAPDTAKSLRAPEGSRIIYDFNPNSKNP